MAYSYSVLLLHSSLSFSMTWWYVRCVFLPPFLRVFTSKPAI